MLTGHDIICLSSIDWDFNWQGHQEIMAAFARQGNRVLFVENTGVRAPTPRDLPRLVQRLRNWRKGLKGFRQAQERVWVYSPVALPFPYSRLARWVNRWVFLRAIRRWMAAAGFHDPIIWTFLPTGTALDVLQHLTHQLGVYYCIADFEALVPDPRKVRRTEAAVVRACDLVFAQGRALEARCRQWNSEVHVFPFGVNLEAFENGRGATQDAPEELRALSRPIIGYVGGVHRHVDLELLQYVASARRGWSIVLVGPVQTKAPALEACRNVVLLGQRAFEQLPAYIRAFDVGIIPYVDSSYTQTVYPTKLNEYHILGKPVVSTALPEVEAFNARHGALVRVARGYPQFVQAIEHALAERDGPAAARRVAAARTHAWPVRIEEMSRLMEAALRRKTTAPQAWQAQLRAVYRRAARRTAAVMGAAALAWGTLFYTPFLWWIAAPLQISQTPVRSDAIVVFAGGVGESGRAGQGYEERVAWAVDLYRRGFGRTLVFSSGYTYLFHETDIMKALAVSLGVPPEDILREDRSANTYENVRYTNDLLDRREWRSVLLVSSPYHMRRAALVWRRLAPEKRVTCAPIPFSRFYAHGVDARGRRTWRQASAEQVQGIVHEYLGLASYWWRGWL